MEGRITLSTPTRTYKMLVTKATNLNDTQLSQSSADPRLPNIPATIILGYTHGLIVILAVLARKIWRPCEACKIPVTSCTPSLWWRRKVCQVSSAGLSCSGLQVAPKGGCGPFRSIRERVDSIHGAVYTLGYTQGSCSV